MSRGTVVVILRIIGAMSGLYGIRGLICLPFIVFALHSGGNSADRFEWAAGILSIGSICFYGLLDICCLYTAYLVFFRFSPNAVKYVLGVTGYFLLYHFGALIALISILLRADFDDFLKSSWVVWFPLLYVFFFFGIIVSYYAGCRRLNHWLFETPQLELDFLTGKNV